MLVAILSNRPNHRKLQEATIVKFEKSQGFKLIDQQQEHTSNKQIPDPRSPISDLMDVMNFSSSEKLFSITPHATICSYIV